MDCANCLLYLILYYALTLYFHLNRAAITLSYQESSVYCGVQVVSIPNLTLKKFQRRNLESKNTGKFRWTRSRPACLLLMSWGPQRRCYAPQHAVKADAKHSLSTEEQASANCSLKRWRILQHSRAKRGRIFGSKQPKMFTLSMENTNFASLNLVISQMRMYGWALFFTFRKCADSKSTNLDPPPPLWGSNIFNSVEIIYCTFTTGKNILLGMCFRCMKWIYMYRNVLYTGYKA